MRHWIVMLVLCIVSPAFAGQWQIDPAASNLTFQGKQADETFNGAFKKFTVETNFDEAALKQSQLTVMVDMASAVVDGKDRMESLPTADWFDVKSFATAQFVSRSIEKTGDHAFVAVGDITLRGVKKELRIPFTLKPAGAATAIDGAFTLMRNDYKIGQGRWVDEQWVAFSVEVKFHLIASQK